MTSFFASLARFGIAAALASSAAAWAQTATVSPPPAPPMPPARSDAQVLYLKSLAATCANCHGTNGKAPDGAAVVSLAGMPQDYIVAQMAAFKSGARTATIMHQLAKGYSDAQINAIAGYFAAQKK